MTKTTRLSPSVTKRVKQVVAVLGPFKTAELLTVSHMTVRAVVDFRRVSEETASRIKYRLPEAEASSKLAPQSATPPRPKPSVNLPPDHVPHVAMAPADCATLVVLLTYIDVIKLAVTFNVERPTLRAAVSTHSRLRPETVDRIHSGLTALLLAPRTTLPSLLRVPTARTRKALSLGLCPPLPGLSIQETLDILPAS